MRHLNLFAAAAIVCGMLTVEASAEQRDFAVAGVGYTIEIRPEHVGGYDRDDWSHWDGRIGGRCFNTRDKVLAEESFTPVETVPSSGGRCRVVVGHWHDPYTGKVFTDASHVDVDHVVPLHEAHKSGGHVWDSRIRQLYANDLEFKDHLIAVEARENRVVKGDRDPKDYLPRKEHRCAYAGAWVKIKHRWRLAMDRGEADAVATVMEGCN